MFWFGGNKTQKNNENIIFEKEVLTGKFQVVEKLESKTFSINFIEKNGKNNAKSFNITEKEKALEYVEYAIKQYWFVINALWKEADFEEKISPWIMGYGTWLEEVKKEKLSKEEDWLLLDDLEGFDEEIKTTEDKIKNITRWQTKFERLANIFSNEEVEFRKEAFWMTNNITWIKKAIEEDLKIFENETYAKDFWIKVKEVRKTWNKKITVELDFNEHLFSPFFVESLKRNMLTDYYQTHNKQDKYSKFWKTVIEDIEEIANGYFYDKTDLSTDFFHMNWFVDVEVALN